MAIVQADSEPRGFVQRATGWPGQARSYFEELQLEMRRVTWPNWKQVRATTTVVIVSVFAFAAYFAVVDQIVSAAVAKLFTAFTR